LTKVITKQHIHIWGNWVE